MKKTNLRILLSILLSILATLLAAAGAFLWANGMMDSLEAFRSPLADHPPKPGETVGEPMTERLVIILVDALRLDTSLDPQVMPTLNTLRARGAWATMHSRPPSFSSPGWTTILTGAWPEINDSQLINPPDNEHVRTFTQDDLFATADRAGYQTAVSGYAWFEGMLANSGVDAGFYTLGEDHAADVEVVAAARPWLESGDYQLVLIHLDQVDYAGHHEGGPRDPRWEAAATRVDGMIEEIVSWLDLDKDTVMVLSDHGHIDQGGHGGQEPITLSEPFILVGNGVLPKHYTDIQMVDVAPTAAALLGTSLPASSQGRVLTWMCDCCPGELACKVDDQLRQKRALLGAYTAATGFRIPEETSLETDAQILEAMEMAKASHLAKVRTLRAIFALIAAMLPIVILIRKGSRRTLILAGGALLYSLVFNLTYTLVFQKTYSLSSVTSANDLIFSNAGIAAFALLLAWLAVMLGGRALSQKPAQAALTTFGLVGVVLYTLALPVLWHITRNGLVLNLTLPEFGSMFLAFLSLLQALFVSLVGLVLAGVAAGVARLGR